VSGPRLCARGTALLALLAVASCAGPGASEVAASDAAAAPPASDSRPSAPTSPDVPEGSTDPLLDGMTSIVRELLAKGFNEAERESLGMRLCAILEVAALGGMPGSKREADRLALTLLEINRDYRPKNAGSDPKRVLSGDEEQRVRLMAEALTRDLRRRLDPNYRSPWPPYIHPVASPPAGYEAVRWETLIGFEYREGMVLPEEVRRLHGRPVAVAGYVYTFDEVDADDAFLLKGSDWHLTFGTPPPKTECVIVLLPEGRRVQFRDLGLEPVTAVGVLEVGEVFDVDGTVMSVYRLNVDGPDSVFKSRDP
jgi:hypothetical protein